MRDAAEREDGAARGQRGQVGGEIVVAGAYLGRRRLVVRRQAFHRVRDPAGDEREAVVAPGRDRLRREAVRVQRRVQQDPGVIAGERPAAGVRAVHSRREPDDHERGVGGAERRHRSAEVARIRLVHAIEERREPRAAAAIGVVRRRRGGFWQNVGARHGGEAYHDQRTPPLPARQRLRCRNPSLTMLPAEPKLEVRSCLPPRANGNGRKPPLLFVHGGYCDAWCWAPHFLPWFAAKGYARARALAARPRRVGRPRDDVRDRPRRFRRRRRARRCRAARRRRC